MAHGFAGLAPPSLRWSRSLTLRLRTVSVMVLLFRSLPSRRLQVSTEFLSHRAQNLFGEGVLLARTEADVESRSEHIGGNSFIQSGIDGPAAFAGILHEAGVIGERWILRQRHRREIEQPGGNHASATPNFGNVGQI